MPLSNAERQKRYRERLKNENAEKYEEIRKKNLENIKNKKKKVSEMTEEERNKQRKIWRNSNNKRALKKKGLNHTNTEKPTTTITDVKKKYTTLEENEKLKRNIKNLKRQLRRYKAEINKLKQKLSSLTQIQSTEDTTEHDNVVSLSSENTPKTKTNQFLKCITVSDEDKQKIKKKLLFMNTLTNSLKSEYENADSNEKKLILKKVAQCNTAEKYKFKTRISKSLGLKRIARSRKSKNIITNKNKKEIEVFFVRDDISRSTAGKQECITRNKDKKQKRYMLDTMQKLHIKYRQEGGLASYATFTRHRPFFVTTPKIQDRNTCACIKHSNFAFKVIKLRKIGVIACSNIDDLIKSISCGEDLRFDCMYSKCNDCINKTPEINRNINKDWSQEIQWLEWRRRTHIYSKMNNNGIIEEKTTKKYTKEIIDGTVEKLTNEFLKDIKTFKTHYYNIKHQQKAFRNRIENLQKDEVVLVCDFSENYACKQAEEIQSVHFGASRNQISLHTCVLYEKNKNPMSICSISPVNDHGPGAIWAHLDPILKYIKSKLIVKKIHIFSDGPTTQYRNKNNFYLFTQRLSDYTFEEGTWNFFEASHGKGPADGVGGAIKRKLDQHVAHGHDIINAEEAYSYLQDNTKVRTYYVSQNDINEISQKIPSNVIPLKGTMKLHQIIYNGQDKHKIYYRLLSCICEGTEICSCGDEIKQHILLPSRSIDFQTITNKKDDETIRKEQNKNRKTEKTLNINQNNKETQDYNEKTHETKNDEETSNKKQYNEKTKDTRPNNDEMQAKKDNIKVTLLSSVRVQPQNEPFRKMLPLVLTPRNISYDIFTGQDLKETQSLKQRMPKRSADTDNYKENVKFKRFKSLSSGSLSGSSTSIDSNIMSIYSDTEILSDDSDPNRPGKHIDRHEVAGIHCNEEIEYENELKPHKEQPGLLVKDKQEELYDQPMEEIKNIEYKENANVNHRVEIIRSQESSKANSENEDFCSGSNVLVRYFLKKSWKYFVGVILTVHRDTNMYTVSFYKTVRRNNILKFITPKRKDEDTLPHLSIVKTAELLQINENPIEFVLMNDEDEVYFTEEK